MTALEHSAPAALLAVNNIEVIYNHVILVLKGVSLTVPERGIVALLGANGAGKTTSLKAISNLLRAERGEVTKGSISFAGARIDRLAAADVVKRGLIQVMEGRHCFAHLTVEENLLTGAYTRHDGRTAIAADMERVYGYFPRLKARRRSLAGYTSGGEQQMVALGRALMARPQLVLLDEPWRRSWSRKSSRSSRGSMPRPGSPSSSPNRIPTSRCAMPATATSWKTAGSSWTAPRRGCARTRTSRNSPSGCRPPAAKATATSNSTAAASAGCLSGNPGRSGGGAPLGSPLDSH